MINTVERVKTLAESKNMTLTALADAAGIDITTFHATKRRSGQLRLITIDLVCQTLNINISCFFCEGRCQTWREYND